MMTAIQFYNIAAERKFIDIIKVLIEYDVNFNVRNKKGLSPFDIIDSYIVHTDSI